MLVVKCWEECFYLIVGEGGTWGLLASRWKIEEFASLRGDIGRGGEVRESH